ncbi:hypothetical protein BD626DRAFT_485428 [Schizophyllum amplum]|uniref:Uncharacterized protein n=1 Tax=Schizophyllum amplum TaxID=97359 RepID=A0A550CLK9_9AGAR|nr:hypothetical protein BD626DRAFT_485428 [Auriculariopsis ampla]
MLCTKWFLPLIFLPLPTAPPLFLLLFIVSLVAHAKPCFYCIILISTIFVSSCYWQPLPIDSPLSTPWSDEITTFAQALRASLGANYTDPLPAYIRPLDRCWCDLSNGFLQPFNVSRWERDSVLRLSNELEANTHPDAAESAPPPQVSHDAQEEQPTTHTTGHDTTHTIVHDTTASPSDRIEDAYAEDASVEDPLPENTTLLDLDRRRAAEEVSSARDAAETKIYSTVPLPSASSSPRSTSTTVNGILARCFALPRFLVEALVAFLKAPLEGFKMFLAIDAPPTEAAASSPHEASTRGSTADADPPAPAEPTHLSKTPALSDSGLSMKEGLLDLRRYGIALVLDFRWSYRPS